MYLYDYHIHSKGSTDGLNTIDEICQRAIKVGLKEIAFTEHFEPTEKDQQYLVYAPKKVYAEFLDAKFKYENILEIKFGVEMGQPHRYKKYSQKLLSENNYDYVLGSAHKMEGDIDFGVVDYLKVNINEYCRMYLSELKMLVEIGDFDCVAHFDLIKRYAARQGVRIRMLEYRQEIESILKILIQRGKGIEINTSGLRQESRTCLPDLDMITLYKKLGGEVLTIGSDSHFAKDVGKGVAQAIEIAKIAGFRYITTFTNRKPKFIKIDDKNPRISVEKALLLV